MKDYISSQTSVLITHYRRAMPFGNRKIILDDLFNSVLLKFEKYHSSGNLKFNHLGIFQSFKLRVVAEKIFQFLVSFSLQILWNVMG